MSALSFLPSASPGSRARRLLALAALCALGACASGEPGHDTVGDAGRRSASGAARDGARIDASAADSRIARDDYGSVIGTAPPARRIVSLNPTTTEILFGLGAGDAVVGRSRWDQWPAAARAVPEVGDAIRPSVERIVAARPDLVLLYASGDNRAAAAALGAAGVRVVALRVDRVADFVRCVRVLGQLAGREREAQVVVDSVERSLAAVRTAMRDVERPAVFLHVWDNPLMAIGGGSFLSELVEVAGGRNVYADRPEPSPQVSFEDLVQRDPAVILAGPVEVERLRRDARWAPLRAVRDGRVLAYDTSLVARPSLRLGEAARALARLLHPQAAVPK